MLSEQAARNLGFKGKFYYQIESPSFLKPTILWHKDKITQSIHSNASNKQHQYSFCKVGKTFGFQTKRFIEFQSGILLYYEDEKDKQCRGYCNLSNVYFYYLKTNDRYLMYLTNGNEHSQFFFPDNSFYTTIGPSLLRTVIQLNFNQKFDIQKMIGKGSFSKVYEGRSKETGERMAIKIVPKKDKNGVSTKSIVEQEKRIMNILDSEYTCQLTQFYEEDQVFIFVLEYLEGEDLMNFIKKNSNITIREGVTLLRQILEGLLYCHSSKVMHRDIKPQNIILDTKTKKPKLIDFGLSLYVDKSIDHNKFKRCGTMGYMAYEVIQNTSQKRKMYNYKCDIFSYGIIAHMLLLGFNPLKGKNYEETYAKNRQCNIDLDEQAITEKFGEECFELLYSLLQKDPQDRATAKEALNSPFFSEENIKKMEQRAQKYLNKQVSKQESSKTIEDLGSNEENLYNFSDNDLQIKIPRVNSLCRRPINFVFNQQ